MSRSVWLFLGSMLWISVAAGPVLGWDEPPTDPGSKPPRASSTGGKGKERAITVALIWLANHQSADGSWSLGGYKQRCIDNTCTSETQITSDAGGTALGLLPFLGAGQTHKTKGPYRETIGRAIDWLMKHQQPDGNLAKGSPQMMYGHGLAAIALSEAYGLSGDKQVGKAAQQAVNFIVAAQDPGSGGWRYNPRDPGDTSVLGWQLTALKSAKAAQLEVPDKAFSHAAKYLDSVSLENGTRYGYMPGTAAAPTMTAVGLLGRQFLGAKRDNPMLTGGMAYLAKRLPDKNAENVYYWYYGTQFMHNMGGNEWDAWKRILRETLTSTQVRDNSCANGSWDPAKDAWGKQGGRLMKTSLSILALEVYYCYLPIFKYKLGE